jgi:hypothetical protein
MFFTELSQTRVFFEDAHSSRFDRSVHRRCDITPHLGSRYKMRHCASFSAGIDMRDSPCELSSCYSELGEDPSRPRTEAAAMRRSHVVTRNMRKGGRGSPLYDWTRPMEEAIPAKALESRIRCTGRRGKRCLRHRICVHGGTKLNTTAAGPYTHLGIFAHMLGSMLVSP